MGDFEFHVGGIEDGIIALQTFLYGKRADNPAGYLKDIASYGGELEPKDIQKAIDQLSLRLPLALVAYGDGVDKEMPAISSVFGQPRIWRHTCDFIVVACTNNARGEKQQRRGGVGDVGVYKIIEDVRESLTGVRFVRRGDSIVVMVPNRKLQEGDVLLNLEPFRPKGVGYMARLEGLTAYAVHFETYFTWTEPDRREADIPVEELIFDLETLNQATDPGGKPGVELQ